MALSNSTTKFITNQAIAINDSIIIFLCRDLVASTHKMN